MFHAGQQIGVYILIERLGKGGFGEVWLAENRNHSPSEKVAVKLPRTDQIDLQAVKDEIFNWILSGKHKNILPIIECETFGNQIAIVSEYAPDGSLQDLINKKGSLPTAEAIEIAVGILDGLAHLHNRKIIHRDLKPDNVLFQGRVPRLTDFGISRAMTVSSQSRTVSGTLSYMAPEAFDGKRNAQTDIWAVGVILYQLLTGNLPFPQKGMIELVGALARQAPAPLPASTPPDLQTIVKKALAKESSNRYQTAAQMAQNLQEFSQKNFEETLKIPSNEILQTKAFPENDEISPKDVFNWIRPSQLKDKKIGKPITDKTDSVVTNVKVPSQTNETETTIRPVSLQKPQTNLGIYLLSAIGLLFVVIIGGAYFLSGNKNVPANENSKTFPISSPSPVADMRLIPFRKGDKFGFSNESKKIIIEPKYDFAMQFNEEGLASVRINEKWGRIDKTGKEIIPAKYDSIGKFKEGLAKVYLDKKFGFIDKTGKEVIPLKYANVSDFSEGLACVELNNKYGFIDKAGKEVISPKYDIYGVHILPSFSEELARVQFNGKWVFIDKIGKEVIPLKYDDASNFSEGLAVVTLNGKDGFIDKAGKEVIPLKYDDALYFSGGLARVKLNEKWGFIDKTGKEIILPKYDEVDSFSEGLAAVKLNNKHGFINKTGQEVISLEYDDVWFFSDGLAGVKLNNKYGFIDKAGKEVIPLKYDMGYSFYFEEGLSQVKLNGKEFYIDKKGTEYYEP